VFYAFIIFQIVTYLCKQNNNDIKVVWINSILKNKKMKL